MSSPFTGFSYSSNVIYGSVSTSDSFAVYSASNGSWGTASLNSLLTLFQAQFASPTFATTVYTPLTGSTVSLGTPTSNLWVLLQPAGTLAALTISLPLNTSVPDGTEVLVTSTQILTSLTVSANGASNVYGAPTTLAAVNGYFKLRFVTSTNSWYRIG